jgi:hypothetical protein
MLPAMMNDQESGEQTLVMSFYPKDVNFQLKSITLKTSKGKKKDQQN